MRLQLQNTTLPLIVADTFYKRLLGFMFQHKPVKNGILFPKTNGIHTFFMFQEIDIILTDDKQQILYIFSHFRPNHILLPKRGVVYTYELPAGSSMGLQVGQILSFIQK